MKSRIRVAVLDDEKHVRESTAILMQRYCPTAEIVLSADPAHLTLDFIARHKPEIVLVDLSYGGTHDWSPRDLHQELGVPVIIITAHDTDTMKNLYPDVPYLLKPISGEALQALLHQLLPQSS